jgi:hypothetical protein
MRILAIHDEQGNIRHIVVSPAGAPLATAVAEPGLLVTEVERPEETAGLDLSVPESRQRLIEALENMRVEMKAEAKPRLVRIHPEDG